MTKIDYILLGIVLFSTLYGFALGLINSVGTIVGVFLGTYIAGNYFRAFGDMLTQYISNDGLANILAFIILFILVNKLTGLVFSLLDKIFKIIAIIPFLKTINRLLGAILGFIEGVLAVSIMLYIVSRYPISQDITNSLIDSQIAPLMVRIANIVAPLLPDMVNKLQAII